MTKYDDFRYLVFCREMKEALENMMKSACH